MNESQKNKPDQVDTANDNEAAESGEWTASKILFGSFQPLPMSRNDFLKPALGVLLIRQPIAFGLSCLLISMSNENVLTLAIWAITILFLIPYLGLAYRRIIGSRFPHPAAFLAAVVFIVYFFPSPEDLSIEALVFEYSTWNILYLILFLLPNRVLKQ